MHKHAPALSHARTQACTHDKVNNTQIIANKHNDTYNDILSHTKTHTHTNTHRHTHTYTTTHKMTTSHIYTHSHSELHSFTDTITNRHVLTQKTYTNNHMNNKPDNDMSVRLYVSVLVYVSVSARLRDCVRVYMRLYAQA